MKYEVQTQWGNRALGLICGVVASLALFFGCAAQDASLDAAGVNNQGNTPVDSYVQEAQNLLFENQILAANQKFKQGLTANSGHGSSAAGAALTDILLLPYDPAVSALLREHLGATTGLDANKDVIYSEGGLLYLMSRGVPFDDGDGFPGIKTLLVSDLPWSSRQLDTVGDFVQGLDSSVSDMMDVLVLVADALDPIQQNLDVAIADPNFTTIFVPGEVFHDTDLSLVIGKTELLALKTALHALHGGIYFLAAYEWDFSIEDLLGDQFADIQPNDPDYVEGWDSDDYALRYLDERLFRTVRNTAHIETAFVSADRGLTAFLTLLRDYESHYAGELEFSSADDLYVQELTELLTALQGSLTRSTPIPFTTPAVSMDLTPFKEGRVLPPGMNWLERVEIQDEFGSYFEWQVTNASMDTVVIQGVFTPEFTAEDGIEFEMSGNAEGFGTSVAGPLQEDVEDAYFSGR